MDDKTIIAATLQAESLIGLAIVLGSSYIAGQYLQQGATAPDDVPYSQYLHVSLTSIGLALATSIILRVIYRDPLKLFDYDNCYSRPVADKVFKLITTDKPIPDNVFKLITTDKPVPDKVFKSITTEKPTTLLINEEDTNKAEEQQS